ncbi:MAG: GNAT family N-acetyltransferase [Phycisphaerae bacterium]
MGIQYTRIRFIGSDATCTTNRNLFDKLFSIDKRYGWSDLLDFLYRAEDVEGLIGTLQYLKQQKRWWDILDLRELCSNTRSIKPLKDVLGSGHWLFNEVAAKVAIVSLKTDFETYRKTRTKNWRKNISRAYNRVDRLPQVIFGKYTSPSQVGDIMPAVIDLEKRSWQGSCRIGAFSQNSTREFHRELAKSLAERGRFVLYTLESAHKVVCYQYALKYNGQLCLHNIAMDPDFKHYSPGFYLQVRIIEEAFSEGLKRVVLGRGPEDYKSKLKNAAEDRIWVTVFGTKIVPSVLRYLEFKARPTLKGLVHSNRTTDKI